MTPPVPVGVLIFGDEFDGSAGSKPDPMKWKGKLHGLGGVILDGLTNIELDGDSHMVITAHKEADGWHSGFLSGLLAYSGARYVEASVKVSEGKGTWTGACWEWPPPDGETTSLNEIELDICEQLGDAPSQYHATVHNWYGGNKTGPTPFTVPAKEVLGAAFHVYGAAVYPDHIDFYLDGVHMKNLKGNPATVTAASVGIKDFTTSHVVANLSQNMGGWGGPIEIPGPISTEWDFLHVWELA